MINEYHFDKLVVGGSLESLLYSFVNDFKVIILEQLYPLEVDEMCYEPSLRLLGYNSKEVIKKAELWDRLTFVLSMNGCLVSPNIISSHRESDDRLITVTERNKRVTYSADEIINFDKVDDENILMLDWFNVRSGNNHKHKLIEDHENKFINRVHFYRSSRTGANSTIRDILAVSEFTTKESQMVDHSEGIARIKTLQMMKDNGIRGQSNGTNKLGTKLHYALKIEHTFRENRKKYKPLISLTDLLKQEPEKEERWNLTKKLFRHKQITTLQESFQLPANL
jgi:hypothetical protein